MKKTKNSFKLLWQAIVDSRRPMWASIQVLIVLTIILVTIFYFAEREAQPEEYNYWRSLLWGFTRYIGDPGNFAGNGPVTLTGRIVASCIGIVGILIFAVPAGLVASGFSGAIDKELRKEHLVNIGQRLTKGFRRRQDNATMYMCVPRYIPVGLLQAQKHMTEKDIIDAVDHNPPFRLRYLQATDSRNGYDKVVVEMFPFNTPYGCCIDRGANVTIVCPTSNSEPGIGNFSYYLALIGGFNYISKEVERDVDEPASYYIIPKGYDSPQFETYLNDLKRLSKDDKHWTIFMISSETQKEADVHFITNANAKAGRESTVIDIKSFNDMFENVSKSLNEKFDILTDLNAYRPAGSRNISVIMGGGITANAFSVRIYTDITVWDNRYISIAEAIAESINGTVGNQEYVTQKSLLKERGLGYQQ